LSTKLIPSYQIATLLEYRGWHIQVEYDMGKARASLKERLVDMLVVDVDDPTFDGIDTLLRFKSHQPASCAVALRQGYPGKPMYLAHNMDADGCFYVNHSGYMLDITRGLVPFLLTEANKGYPKPDRQLSKISGLTLLNQLPFPQTG
jgi:CheY-like chemotaxis protein